MKSLVRQSQFGTHGWIFWLCILQVSARADDMPTVQQLDFFERQIRPVLLEHCYGCHSGELDKKRQGGLNLSYREGLLTGGDSGPAVLPGKPEASLLIAAIRYQTYEMPPSGKLPDRVIEDFVKWVQMGAPDPRMTRAGSGQAEQQQREDVFPVRPADLWSLQPVTDIPPPHVPGVANEIDRFIQARLSRESIPSAPAAPARVLLRRLFFDLIGLPPSRTDLAAFNSAVKEDRAAAIGTTVDRLLDSHEFGERWARHWLDLTSYADTMGVGRAIPALEAWRYRDYVIDAFHADKPFDDFIREQIAGDITVPPGPRSQGGNPPTAEQIIATGFLAIGPWELVGGDKVQLRMDVVDKQVHRVGQALLGMTFGCARCHDHKFDPISQRDYYGLAGLFSSSVTLNGRIGGVFSAINHRTLPETPEELVARAERIRSFQAEIDSVTRDYQAADERSRELDARIKQLGTEQQQGDEKGTTLGADKKISRQISELRKEQQQAAGEAEILQSRLTVLQYVRPHRTQARALALMDAPEPQDCCINIRGNAHQLGEPVPRGFPAAIAPMEKPRFTRGGSGRIQLAEWLTSPRNPLTARVWVNRVWHHLFGAGLVRTVDNFGARGELPSHPKLLDYLAFQFMREGWSTKQLIRRIVMTRTWQQHSINREAVARGVQEIDPENRLLWRAHRRRLEAEAIRDMMLATSGQLDCERGGPTLPMEHPKNLNPALTGSLKPDAKFPERLTFRRTIYQPQKRKSPFSELDFLSTFDLPDPNQETGRRAITTVPTQALALLNSTFVRNCSTAMAAQFLSGEFASGESSGSDARSSDARSSDARSSDARSSDDLESEIVSNDAGACARVEEIYLTIYGRAPTAMESREALAFVDHLRNGGPANADSKTAIQGVKRLQAWSRLCHSLLISNEALFRD